MIYLIVDENFVNPESLNQAVEIITSNLGNYPSVSYDKLNQVKFQPVRYFGFDKSQTEDAFNNYWSPKGNKFKLVEVSFKSSFNYIPFKVKEPEVMGEVGSF